jgi:hypothetical protein
MQLDPDFREFVESFNDHEVRYLVVGGYALAAHGLTPSDRRSRRVGGGSVATMPSGFSQR